MLIYCRTGNLSVQAYPRTSTRRMETRRGALLSLHLARNRVASLIDPPFWRIPENSSPEFFHEQSGKRVVHRSKLDKTACAPQNPARKSL